MIFFMTLYQWITRKYASSGGSVVFLWLLGIYGQCYLYGSKPKDGPLFLGGDAAALINLTEDSIFPIGDLCYNSGGWFWPLFFVSTND